MINNFVDVTANLAFSTASCVLDLSGNPPPGVTQPAGPNTRIEVSDVSKLIFRFEPAFKPVDIMFAQTSGTTDDDGRSNFASRIRQQRAGAWRLVVVDLLNDGGPAGTANFAKWKFFIAIQRIADGKIGIIDPEVSNVDQD